ncbi:hypothetical protein E4T43_03638 [Aureobasidium subglaciale]|nr:hypothetical protein E4T43_03638 [Aureobasidium subglaciale]
MKQVVLCALGSLATLVVAPPPPVDLDHNKASIVTTIQPAQIELGVVGEPRIIDGSLESSLREVPGSTNLEAGHRSDSDSDAEDDEEAWGHCMKVCKWKSSKQKGKSYGDNCHKKDNPKFELSKQEKLAMHRRDEGSTTTPEMFDSEQTELGASVYKVEDDDMVLDEASINEANTNIDFGEASSDDDGEDKNDKVETYEDENYMVTDEPFDHDMDYVEANVDESSITEANIDDIDDAETFDTPPDGIDIEASSNFVNLDKRWKYHCENGMESCLKDCHLKAFVMIPPLIPWRWIKCRSKCDEACTKVDKKDKKDDESKDKYDSDDEHEPKGNKHDKDKTEKKDKKDKNEEDDDSDYDNVKTPSALVTLNKRTDCEKGYDKCMKSCHAWAFLWPPMLIAWRWKKCPTSCGQACYNLEKEQKEEQDEFPGEPTEGEPIQAEKGGKKHRKEKTEETDNHKHRVEALPADTNMESPSGLVTLDKRETCEGGLKECLGICHRAACVNTTSSTISN